MTANTLGAMTREDGLSWTLSCVLGIVFINEMHA